MSPKTSTTRPRLQRSSVVERAMAVADAEGLEAVTIRRLAQDLGVSPMALYWHFADKDALLGGISERLWEDTAAELVAAPGGEGGWAEIEGIADALVRALRRHPGCASLAPRSVLACEPGRELTERVLAILSGEGLAPDRAAELAHFLLTTVVTLADTRPGSETGVASDEELLRAKRVALKSLPADRYPHLTAMADYLVDCADDDAYFRRGVQFAVGGLRAQSASPEGAAARR